MTSVDIDENLREKSKELLRKLKEKQSRLQFSFSDSAEKQQLNDGKRQLQNISNTPVSSTVCEQLDTSLKKTVPAVSSRDGRARLQRRRTKSREEKLNNRLIHCNKEADKENIENTADAHVTKYYPSKDLDIDKDINGTNKTDPIFLENEVNPASDYNTLSKNLDINIDETDLKQRGTPNAARRRKIIDRNVKVSNTVSDLNASTLLRECEEDFARLNYSYSNVEDSDLKFLQERFAAEMNNEGVEEEIPVRDTDPEPRTSYSANLENPGNSRTFAKFIRDSKKPKSILLSTSHRQNKSSSGNTSRVSFVSPTRDASKNQTFQLDSTARQNQRMLGYDWIAALIENDPEAVNQSETFFEDLKEFRKINLQECVNDRYMDGAQQLWEHPEQEPEEVQKALEETKVKPYMVNDRLFAEPIQRNMFAEYDYKEPRPDEKEKEGTYDEPRFVRVSVPRSTLMSPYRVKPHRRGSFDAADTMALSSHCLKGWTSAEPSMMPPATNIALRDSTLGIKAAMKTTLHDAEKLAANYPYHWNAIDQTISRPMPKPLYRPEANCTESNFPYAVRPGSSNPKGLKEATDDLLNSTYSLMFEMQRLKQQRSDDPIRL